MICTVAGCDKSVLYSTPFGNCDTCSVLHHLHMHILSLLFPVAHYFIITSCMHDYSQFTSAFTLITQCLIVPLYPCYVVVVFCCYAPVYITLCTSCNNLQPQFNLITPIVIHCCTLIYLYSTNCTIGTQLGVLY